MTADLLEASSEVSRDLSPQWLELSSQVRRLATETLSDASAAPLAESALKLCEHVERLHADVEQLLESLAADAEAWEADASLHAKAPEPTEIDHANLQIQREMHQKSDLQHIIKALFMWKDNPEQRVRGAVD